MSPNLSSSPTSSGLPSSSTNPSYFDPGSSPPLILAFIGVGIFGLGLVLLFGYRRFTVQPPPPVRTPPSDYYSLIGHLDKPKLFDVWIRQDMRNSKKMPDTWRNITPVSVTCPSPMFEASNADYPTPMHFSRFSSFLPWKRQATPLPSAPLSDSEIPRAQVAVLISMPKSPKHTDEGMEDPEYQIGLTEATCSNG